MFIKIYTNCIGLWGTRQQWPIGLYLGG